MSTWTSLSAAERRIVMDEASARLGLNTLLVEKDFWVTWLLREIFEHPQIREQVVFKGGTSLSKVYQVIGRFSEDIDLSISPSALGFSEEGIEQAATRTLRDRLLRRLQDATHVYTRGPLLTELELALRRRLGDRSGSPNWLAYESDPTSKSPVLWFEYPSVLSPAGTGYVRPAVKVEMGSLVDQQPIGDHEISPMLADVLPGVWQAPVRVVALEIERTFWEKATILHAEHYRPTEKALPLRLSRHYSDMASLWTHPVKQVALGRFDLLDRVVAFKHRYFSSAWARYEDAKLGTLRLSPRQENEQALTGDYRAMQEMFFHQPPPFADVLEVLRHAELEINSR